MKKFCLLILTLSILNAIGQTHLVGVKGGPNWTDINSVNFVSHHNYKRGITSGLSYDYLFGKHLSAGTDFIYNQRGFTYDQMQTDYFGNPTDNKYTTSFNYDYLSLPIKVGYNIGSTFYGFTTIGVIPSLLILSSISNPTSDFYGELNGSERIDMTNRVSKFDFACFAEVGGGYKFKNNIWLYTSLLYQNSFTSITNSNYFPTSKIKHNGITLAIGMKLVLIKE